jgi:hypothetical protein
MHKQLNAFLPAHSAAGSKHRFCHCHSETRFQKFSINNATWFGLAINSMAYICPNSDTIA